MPSRVRVVRLQIPNNMPQKAYREHTVFPYNHLCGRAKGGCEKEKEDGAKQRQREKINEGRRREREKEKSSTSITVHIREPTGNHTANQPCIKMNHEIWSDLKGVPIYSPYSSHERQRALCLCLSSMLPVHAAVGASWSTCGRSLKLSPWGKGTALGPSHWQLGWWWSTRRVSGGASSCRTRTAVRCFQTVNTILQGDGVGSVRELVLAFQQLSSQMFGIMPHT